MLGLQWFVSLYVTLSTLFSDPLAPTNDKTLRLAERVLRNQPLIDLHVDLPVVYRYGYRNDVSHVPYAGPLLGHVDLTRLRQGGSGGFFSIAYAECPAAWPSAEARQINEDEATKLFLQPNDAVRDTLEQIDVTHQLVAQNADQIALAYTADDILDNHRHGKLSHLIGVEGGHSLGNSLGVLRTYYTLGVRYVTLTHTCHNAFADTAGSTDNVAATPLHGGLSALGVRLVREMNRIGMLVDVSHTSDDSTRQAIRHSRAPVVFTHSGARALHNHTRNVPDDILEMISEKSGRDSVVGIPVLPSFIGDEQSPPTLQLVADHVEHVARVAGKSRVAIGTDFDGFQEAPIKGIEDVTMYKNLLAELARRGWSQADLVGLVSGNFIRILRKVEQVAASHAANNTRADTVGWSARPDLKKRV